MGPLRWHNFILHRLLNTIFKTFFSVFVNLRNNPSSLFHRYFFIPLFINMRPQISVLISEHDYHIHFKGEINYFKNWTTKLKTPNRYALHSGETIQHAILAVLVIGNERRKNRKHNVNKSVSWCRFLVLIILKVHIQGLHKQKWININVAYKRIIYLATYILVLLIELHWLLGAKERNKMHTLLASNNAPLVRWFLRDYWQYPYCTYLSYADVAKDILWFDFFLI